MKYIFLIFIILSSINLNAHYLPPVAGKLGATVGVIGKKANSKIFVLDFDWFCGEYYREVSGIGLLIKHSCLYTAIGMNFNADPHNSTIYRINIVDFDVISTDEKTNGTIGFTVCDLNRISSYEIENRYLQLRGGPVYEITKSKDFTLYSINAFKLGYTGIKAGNDNFRELEGDARKSHYGVEMGLNSGLLFWFNDYCTFYNELSLRNLALSNFFILEGRSKIFLNFGKEDKESKLKMNSRIFINYEYKNMFIEERNSVCMSVNLGFNYYLGH